MLRLMILMFSLLTGAAAAWLVVTQPTQVSSALAPQPLVDVLVAATEIQQGHKLSNENVRWQTWPEDAVHGGLITRTGRADAVESLKGSVVRTHFVMGEPILETKIAGAGAGFLAAILPSGKLAVAVRITAEQTAGGFILPNDRVDVIHMMQGQNPNHPLSRTILTNVRVLAIDQKAEEVQSEAVLGKTATLELDAQQAEVVTAAAATGTLSLALRSAADAAGKQILNWQKNVLMIRGGQSERLNAQ